MFHTWWSRLLILVLIIQLIELNGGVYSSPRVSFGVGRVGIIQRHVDDDGDSPEKIRIQVPPESNSIYSDEAEHAIHETKPIPSEPQLEGVPINRSPEKNAEKPAKFQSLRRGLDKLAGPSPTQWYPWFKHGGPSDHQNTKPRHQVATTTPYPVWRRTSSHPLKTDEVLVKLRELFRSVREFFQGPVAPFAGGVLACLIVISMLYALYKLLRFVVRCVWNFAVEVVIPVIVEVLHYTGPPLLDFLRLVAYALLAIARACLEMLRDRVRDFRSNRMHLDRTHLLSHMEKQGAMGGVNGQAPTSDAAWMQNHQTRNDQTPIACTVYDRENENVSIVD